jgi:recombination protein RecA
MAVANEEKTNITDFYTEQDKLLAEIRKEFGPQSMFILGKEERLANIKMRPSGSLMLDIALGGGLPHGRLIGLHGAESSGKTTILNLAIAQAQALEPDKMCAIIDLEHSYDPIWAQKLGVDLKRLMITQPDTYAENIYKMIEFMLQSGKYSIIGLDSVDGLIPKDEFEQEDWDKESRVGGASKINSKAMRKLVNSGLLTKSGTTLVFINQLRDKIGGFSMYGTPTTTSGGRSLKHAATINIEVSKGDYFSTGSGNAKVVHGNQIKCKISKNKVAAPHKVAVIDMYYETGLDSINELVHVAKELNILTGAGWLKWIDPSTGEALTNPETKEEYKWNGVPKTKEALAADFQAGGYIVPKMYEQVNQLLRGAA